MKTTRVTVHFADGLNARPGERIADAKGDCRVNAGQAPDSELRSAIQKVKLFLAK
jgi:hypothetical protein